MSAVNDKLGVTYSLVTFLEEEIGVNTVMHYNGMSLPKDLPFIKVRSVTSSHQFLSKSRETVKVEFNHEISVYGKTSSDMARLVADVRKLLLFESIPYHDGTGTKVSGVSFTASIRTEIPIDPKDLGDETRKHRTDFEVSVEGTYYKKNK